MLLGRIVFLQQLKEELIEKLKNPATTYSSMTDIHKQLRQINREIQSIRQMENSKEGDQSAGKKVVQNANPPYENFI
ncbi:hypothetical protein PP175_11375 [Aneurinibacillus sp. Ricciae_BoGa-3]|uniref:hypothetical protein n=1 Tax=Aneurinibacillus sp. Ricciae_BoGa-3 TaxID=3022697 RepID=UPI0023413E41|nr:hypothetical protein [Aneurinibacillus sp. Ricciae_BoGa-3]WCK56458.1 hypothetical protein PP175_11375 [Aneurinibacillus sp. Ricciae_BoGa-3]